MPVYLVRVNNYTRHGIKRHGPELMCLTAKHATVDAAVLWALEDTYGMRLRDIEADVLSPRDDCWFQEGPEEYQ